MLSTRSASQTGAPSRPRVAGLAHDQPAETNAPLLETLDDAGASGRGFPLANRCIPVPLARRLWQPAVGEEAEHVAAAQRRVDQVEQREHATAERPFRDRRAVIEVDGIPASVNTASTSGR